MKAFTINPKARIYVYKDPVSMARSFPGLTKLVKEAKLPGKADDLYVFINKKKSYLKILYHNKGGYCIFAKKLDAGMFDSEGISTRLNLSEMSKLVDEVIVNGGKKVRRLKAANG